MTFRIKKAALLSSTVILLVLSILDISIRKEAVFEGFGRQFLNERKTDAFVQAQRGAKTTSRQQLNIERQDVREVVLAGTRSHISVNRAPGPAIQLQYTVTAYAANADASNRVRESVHVAEEVDNGRLTLAASADGKSIDYDSVSIDYVLLIPDGMKLSLESGDGSVRIQGIKADVHATSDNGFMEIVDVTGNLSVKSSYGSLYMADITGSIGLENRSGEANIEDVQGPLDLNSQSAHNFISRISGKVTGAAKHGSIRLNEISGPVEVRSQTSDIRLNHIRNDIQVTSVSGDIQLLLPEAEGYALHAAVAGGDIQTHLPYPIEKGRGESRMSGVLGDGTWNVEVEATSANIMIYAK